MSHKEELLRRIGTRDARVGIVGLGYVGLPLAVEFAEVGFHIVGIDVSEEKVALLNSGKSYVGDVPSERLAPLVKSGKFIASTNYRDLETVDAISICVPTPLRKTKDPDMSYVIQALEAVAEVAHEGLLVVLESTTYPGTTNELLEPKFRDAGFKIGEDVFIAFSPERIDPSNPTYGVRNTPKVVGGSTPACTEIAVALYSTAVDHVIPVSSPTSAEMVKLLENTFRAVNIGLVNEIALICDRLGINVWEVIEAAKTKPFGFMPFYPGPGLGGHCIPIDPLYLSWKLKTLNYTARFIELASEINASMPAHVLTKVSDALNDDGKAVRGSRIVVLGVAYKKDVDDVRESPALDVLHLLLEKGAHVVYHDPFVPSLRLEDGRKLTSTAYSDALLADADCVVVVTDHSVIDYSHVKSTAHLVVDSRNALAKATGSARVVSL
ncbi:MAG: nucleotide sugar dehydrogenase [Anaerolineae bacterium]|jgi:UDP-N-acetyl-D-glucosamine dehydrogenase|nr:nucleotide sugar dehydrogenase [Chloroflexota bacterium]MCO6442723.1 nucleotide sugar dehydrogenase [Anaerolineae bacterium]MDL1914766.1 nucleotide sugar dehydrogenase [Anaerolineae bacterium CFX4]OQY84524.1 MAG: UDP-N-acetyl-D-glucosamine dehydrogenase [Anaerolineae bacterium UTCFX5]GIK29621.1 MAG: UDP-N-acetyl-D-glucosamine dehydrogenase [Chloroflexota bacterium]